MSNAPTKEEIVNILKKTRENLEKGWIKDDFSHNAEGVAVLPLSPEATCFCFVGAIIKAVGVDDPQDPREVAVIRELEATLTLEYVEKQGTYKVPCFNLSAFNDNTQTTKEAVLGVVDNTLRRLTT